MKSYIDKEFEFFDSLSKDIFSWPETRDLHANWMKSFEYVKEFINKYSRHPREKAKDPDEKKLGNWCAKQRANYKNLGKDRACLLPMQKIRLLESLHGWKWELDLDQIWFNKYHEAFEWCRKNQKIANPQSKNKEESRNGRWLQLQRQKFAKPKYNRSMPLTTEQTNLLRKVPFFYFGHVSKWHNRYIEIQKFIAEFKRLPMTEKYKTHAVEFTLGKWLQRQREFYKKDKLSAEQITLLEELQDWCWEYDLDKKWFEKFEIVQSWCNLHKRRPLSNALDKEEKHHAVWLVRQRGIYKDHARNENRPLTLEQIKKLETLPDWYWSK